MSVYMITYDLNSQGQQYDKVIETIKEISVDWCTYWKSSYLVKSNLTSKEISDRITEHLDGNDTLFVIEVKNNYHGWLSKKRWNYIQENIFN